MNFEQYIPLALRTEKSLPTTFERLEHATLGMITETGEIATEVKRMAIYGKGLRDLDGTGQTRAQHIAEEIGDVAWYLAIAADTLGAEGSSVSGEDDPELTKLSKVEQLNVITQAMAAFVGQLAMAVTEEKLRREFIDAEDFLDSMNNVFGCLVRLADLIEIPFEQILADNIAKLQARFPGAYSNEAAEARADKGGEDARNS